MQMIIISISAILLLINLSLCFYLIYELNELNKDMDDMSEKESRLDQREQKLIYREFVVKDKEILIERAMDQLDRMTNEYLMLGNKENDLTE